MRRFAPILILLACFVLPPATPAAAGLFDTFFTHTLVTIDGTPYTRKDFDRWWKYWKDPKQPLPKTPEPYIDWLLLARAGKRMQLDDDPGFKRQTRIFLEARGLLMLRYDAVDSHVHISDGEIEARYREKYVPRWDVEKLHFKSEGAARAAWEKISKGKLTVDELVKLDPKEGGPESTRGSWLRPLGIDPGWAAIFRKMKVGEVVNPKEHKGGPDLYYLKDQKGADKADLARQRQGIRNDIWKEKEDALTADLIKNLRRKYQVKVDQKRIDALDINAPDDSLTDAVVISTTKRNITEKEFMAVIRKLMFNRPQAAHAAADKKLARKLKNDTVQNIIDQQVTNWACLDRHYEEREPLKWVYQFNYNHRLGMAVEQRAISSKIKVTEDEIKQEYEKNIKHYTQPAMVKIQSIEDTQGPVDKVWADVMTGKNFRKAVEERFETKVKTRELPVSHLDPDVKAVLVKMVVGDTSPIFKAQGKRMVVHLVDRIPAVPLPLKRVEETIRQKLMKKKLEKARNAYLEKIKSRSKIVVEKGQWQAIQKELGGA
jgi:hypothetical protein